MEIYERISLIIKEKGLTKREFANRLITLYPKLSPTGEAPTEKSIYKYLNGTVSIRIDLLPIMAEVLVVPEQAFFLTDEAAQKRFYHYMVEYATDEERETFSETLLRYNTIHKLSDTLTSSPIEAHKREKLCSLLDFAPTKLLDLLIEKLERMRVFVGEMKRS